MRNLSSPRYLPLLLGAALCGPALLCPAAARAAQAAEHKTAKAADGKAADPKVDPEARRAAAAILGQMLRDNASFVHSHPKNYFDPFANGQHPRAIVVGCADSRFHLHAIDATPDGDVFEIRNIGNQVSSVAGSVQYGVHHLKAPLLMIVGHVGCGAVKAAMGDYGSESLAIRHELDGLHLSLRGGSKKGGFDQQWLDNVQRNVHQQVATALQDYREEVQSGQLYVVGAVYDFRDELREGRGKLHIINVNGEASPARVREVALMQEAFRANSAPARSVARR